MIVDEKAKVLFDLLVDSLGLAVSLGMISRRRVCFDAGDSVELVAEEGLVLATSITDELAWFAVESKDMVPKESCHPLRSAVGVRWYDVDLLGEPINEDYNGIVTG